MTKNYSDNYLSQEEKILGILAHFLALFTSIFGPLIIWLIKKDQSEWIDKQAKESLNFQISMAIYQFVAGILMFILVGFVLSIALWIFNLVFVVIATLKARNGENYRYPLCIRLVK
ncbi:MAG: DUF4870 domain-containing protein [Clostridium sp.]|nr:DUF4870 domain-containing protein [Clostridium sp.]